MSEVEHVLRRQTQAAQRLLSSLQEQGVADDAELVADSIEGQTSLHEAIAAALESIAEDEAVAAGCEELIDRFDRRRFAAVQRADRKRAAIELAMIETDSPKLMLAAGTVYLSKRSPSLVIDDEAAIPSPYWTVPAAPPPKLDKSAVKAALKAGEAVPGARLDNGTVVLNIRK